MWKKASLVVIFLLAIAVVQQPDLPWKLWVEAAIKRELKKHNVDVNFTLDHATPGILILKNITIKDFPTTFDTLDVRYSARDLLHKRLVIHRADLHSKDGDFFAEKVTIDLSQPAATKFTVEVRNVPLSTVMQMATGGRADATGSVFGRLPLTRNLDGTFTVSGGKLSAGSAGTLKVAADALPGSNENLTLVREVLADFHYENFSMEINSKQNNKLSMLLQLRGNNPSVYNGREIKLNVRLDGDLLDVWKQSVVTVTDPEKLLQQEEYETP